MFENQLSPLSRFANWYEGYYLKDNNSICGCLGPEVDALLVTRGGISARYPEASATKLDRIVCVISQYCTNSQSVHMRISGMWHIRHLNLYVNRKLCFEGTLLRLQIRFDRTRCLALKNLKLARRHILCYIS